MNLDYLNTKHADKARFRIPKLLELEYYASCITGDYFPVEVAKQIDFEIFIRNLDACDYKFHNCFTVRWDLMTNEFEFLFYNVLEANEFYTEGQKMTVAEKLKKMKKAIIEIMEEGILKDETLHPFRLAWFFAKEKGLK